jgi:hypothetical protein
VIRAAALALALALAFAPLTPAGAETVYIRSGQHEGQGWVFLHPTGCWMATAGHVVGETRAGVIVIGASGASAQGDLVVRDPRHDLAIVRLAGALARACPASPLGDRDVMPMLDRVQHEGAPILFERRNAKAGATSVSYGVEFVGMQVLGISEASSTFTLRPERRSGDAIAASDSGGPIRFRGSGLGEAGLPLGIVTEIARDRNGTVVVALRMDVVRAFFDGTVAQTPKPPERNAPISIAAFSGETPDTACGPLNLLSTSAACGWRARRTSAAKPIALTLDVGEVPGAITAVELRFSNHATPQGIAVATSAGLDRDWQGERYCTIPAGRHEVICAVGARTARGVKIVVDGGSVEIIGLRVISQER